MPAAKKPRRSREQEPAEPDTPSTKSTLTTADWISCAMETLVEHGFEAVRVDVLAKEMGVTRGSFYWHFKGRDDLLRSMLNTWRDNMTEQVIQRFENRDPRQLVPELISLPFHGRTAKRAASIELAIRAWARRDPMARQAVDEVDERRLSYHAQVFSALGFSISEARTRAFLIYAQEIAESLLANQGNDAQKAKRSELFERLILMPLPDDSGPPEKSRKVTG